jgi:hypothetical protein
MNNKVLLREYYELCEGGVCQDFLTESEKREVAEGKAMYLTGIIQRAKAKNQNGRVYPREVLEREVENYQKVVRENRALGELDHPEDSVVNLKNVSHLMTQIWWEGDSVMGKCKILNTPSGQILQSLVQSNVTLGISSRGMGSVHEDRQGNTVVEDDFNLICFDFVSDPSTIGAFMSLAEGKVKTTNVYTKADKINRLLNDIVRD